MKYTPKLKQHVLIVDDARDIRDSLSQYLGQQGLSTSIAADAAEARKILSADRINLVILDIMMPGEDGLSLCRWLAENSRIPVILLTAMATDMDRIVGLEVGADDYIVKPFNPRLLLARVRAVLRRLSTTDEPVRARNRRFDKWTHNALEGFVQRDGCAQIKLTTTENRLLEVFLDYPNRVLGRGLLLERAMGREEKAFDRAIDNQIGRLRKKIESDPSRPRILVTEWGGGYKLVVDTDENNTE